MAEKSFFQDGDLPVSKGRKLAGLIGQRTKVKPHMGIPGF
jgi:hypothetical protein